MAKLINQPTSPADVLSYEREWTNEMGIYWRERMQRMQIGDTGHLAQSVRGILHPGSVTTIEHKFAMYGIFVAAGVSPGFEWERWGNSAKRLGKKRRERATSGQLDLLDDGYRLQHGLDAPHKVGPAWGGRLAGGTPKGRRDWFSKKYFSSVMRLNEFEAAFYGAAYQGLLASALDEMFNKQGAARWL